MGEESEVAKIDSQIDSSKDARIDIDAPLWDQKTFIGRFKHFAFVTDPRTVFTSNETLYAAKKLCDEYRSGTESPDVTRDQIIYAKKLYSSAFHPDSGQLQNVFGRMSCQVPGGMFITGAMCQFYRTIPAVVFWQFVNQSYNAFVNYSNRNAKSPVTPTQIGMSYVTATSSAILAAILSKNFLQKHAGAFMQKYVPLSAVIAANFVNIPLMRQTEITVGVDVVDENNKVIGKSRIAAVKGISQVIFSRIVLTAPGMLVLPVIMDRLEPKDCFKRLKVIHAPFQALVAGAFLVFMVPAACSIFPQRCSLNMCTIKRFEKEFYDQMIQNHGENLPKKVYFNKGL